MPFFIPFTGLNINHEKFKDIDGRCQVQRA